MKTFFASLFLLLFVLLPLISLGQSTTEIVKEKVDQALSDHINKLYPPKGCECNDCAHFYKKEFTFTKNMKVDNTLRLWGKAKVIFRNARTGGSDYVLFYAEVKKSDGEIELTKLKWQKGPCMKFETLYQR